ncbi:ATP-dependent RNA helicase DbpA [Modicisalibacter muralis]|uniref:ATP-dependent RNA helicase DbpA n=1 Tax=Modicisalibacter muralis TaxID=119000 RepID=A0A1G9LR62_9GAMM|nr:ATP-dependent RNA helicase DbpA [Halomonas muralis]SDL64428.1 ATP-dependent RNA helicase DbpA [Halomonas muralis]
MTDTAFSQLALRPALLTALKALGYARMTPVQADSLPPLLAGDDLIVQARTGSGKTAAFGLGLLQALDVTRNDVQALVLCPTRELADQVTKALRGLARALPNVKMLTLCGGVPIGPQLASLAHGAHIVVGTPGRIDDHLRKGSLTLGAVRQLVLDEADRMLDMGFRDTLERIVAELPEKRQTLLFSATFPDDVETLSATIQRQPRRVTVDAPAAQASIEQWAFTVEKSAKPDAVIALLHHYQPESALLFCNTKRDCDALAAHLTARGFSALALHGDLEQRERDQVLVRFANHSVNLLVATDVAARGLDVASLDMVISVDPTPDVEVHLHRIGRTGRAGESGLALSLFTPGEMHRRERIEAYQGSPIDDGPDTALDANASANDAKRYAPMVTLDIDGGRKHKLRPGDVVGALTRDGALTQAQIGKIDVFDTATYVAVHNKAAKRALGQIQEGRIKGRRFRARLLR